MQSAQIKPVQETENQRWFVVKTQPRKEALAHQQLNKQGFKTFLPYAPSILRSKKNKAANVRQPLFPGYIFVQIDLEQQRWRAVNSTRGVLYLIQFTNKPSPMPIGATEALIKQTDVNGNFNFETDLKAGDTVRVIGGPMHDFVGELIRHDANGRSMVLLDFMNRKINTVIPNGRLMNANK